MTVITNSGPTLNESDLLRFEEHFRLSLPPDYKSFLLRENGGSPQPNAFNVPTFKENPISSVQVLLGLNRTPPTANLDWYLREVRGAYPKGFIPVGTTSGADMILMKCEKSGFGSIHYWDAYNAPKKPSRKDLYLVSPSFSDFLNGLFENTSYLSAIEYLIKRGDIGSIKNLVEDGYDINEVDDSGRSALENAVRLNNVEIVKYMFSKGAKLKRAEEIARTNLEFWPEYAPMLNLIRELAKLET